MRFEFFCIMKKHVFGRKLKRDTNERKALFKNLLTSLVLNERITTSEAKAKAIKSAADKLITKAKKEGREAYRALEAEVHRPAVVKLVDELAGRFKSRNGGYTRIIKAGHRVADNAAMAVMEWTEKSGELRVENGELKKENKKQTKQTKAVKKEVKKEVVKEKVEVKKKEVKDPKEKKKTKVSKEKK